MEKIARPSPAPPSWIYFVNWGSTPAAWPSSATWKYCPGQNGLKRQSKPATATKSCNLSAEVNYSQWRNLTSAPARHASASFLLEQQLPTFLWGFSRPYLYSNHR